MATIPCYRCGHPLTLFRAGTASKLPVCPNCGHVSGSSRASPSSGRKRKTSNARQKLSPRNASVLAFLIGIVTGLANYGVDAGGKGPDFAIAATLGSAIFFLALSLLLAILAATICLAFGRKFRQSLEGTYSLFAVIIACIILVIAIIGRVNGRNPAKLERERRAEVELAKDAEAIHQAVRFSAETGRPIESIRFPTADTDSEMGRIRQLSQENFQKMVELQQACQQELEKAGYESLFDAERLENDKGFEASRKIVSEGKRITEKYRDKVGEHLASVTAKIKSMPSSLNSDLALRNNIDQLLTANGQKALRMWDIDIELCALDGKVIEMIAASQGKWQFIDGSFRFDSEEDHAKFTAILENTQALLAEQQNIQNEALSRFKSAAEKLAR